MRHIVEILNTMFTLRPQARTLHDLFLLMEKIAVWQNPLNRTDQMLHENMTMMNALLKLLFSMQMIYANM